MSDPAAVHAHDLDGHISASLHAHFGDGHLHCNIALFAAVLTQPLEITSLQKCHYQYGSASPALHFAMHVLYRLPLHVLFTHLKGFLHENVRAITEMI